MKKTKFTEAQIAFILKQADDGDLPPKTIPVKTGKSGFQGSLRHGGG